jgi:hypothetical protein
MKMLRSRIYFGLLGALFLCAACQTISTYDQAAYEHATNAKVDTLALMSEATASYSSHTTRIAELQRELDKAFEYDNGRPLNHYTIESWNTLRGPDGVLNRFLARWKEAGSLSPAFIADKKDHVAREFDDIIKLESGKIKTPQNQ